MPSPWPETPFRLIQSTGIATRPHVPSDHFCCRNAQIMALTHNTMFRGLNAIYHQAPLVQPSTKEASGLLLYCTVVYDFIHSHHTIEEDIYFPAIEAACAIPGLMSENVRQHHQLQIGLEAFRRYASETPVSAYCSDTLRKLIDDMAGALGAHLHEEIPSILDLHDKIESSTLRKIYAQMHDAAERDSDMFKAGPFVLGNQDRLFLLDGQQVPFPEVPSFVPYVVDWVLSYRHRGAWRFNCSDMYGSQRPLPSLENTDSVKTTPLTSVRVGKTLYASLVSKIRLWRFGLLFLSLLSFYVLLASEVGNRVETIFDHGVLSLMSHLTTVFFIFLILVPQIVVSET